MDFQETIKEIYGDLVSIQRMLVEQIENEPEEGEKMFIGLLAGAISPVPDILAGDLKKAKEKADMFITMLNRALLIMEFMTKDISNVDDFLESLND